VSLFRPLPGEEIADIGPIVEEVEFGAGDLLIRRGDDGDCLYILVEGEVVADLPGGGERRMTSGQVLGELAVLAQRPRSADCRAVTPVVALRLDKEAFWELLDRRPELAVEVMRVLVERYVPAAG
jgi:CRP-like cAMP-binding protein